jgi:hypothetical protein
MPEMGVAFGENEKQAGDLSERDPLLSALQNIVIARAVCRGTDVLRVAAGLWFGQSESADGLAARQLGQPSLLLLFAAPAEDGE